MCAQGEVDNAISLRILSDQNEREQYQFIQTIPFSDEKSTHIVPSGTCNWKNLLLRLKMKCLSQLEILLEVQIVVKNL